MEGKGENNCIMSAEINAHNASERKHDQKRLLQLSIALPPENKKAVPINSNSIYKPRLPRKRANILFSTIEFSRWAKQAEAQAVCLLPQFQAWLANRYSRYSSQVSRVHPDKSTGATCGKRQALAVSTACLMGTLCQVR